MGIQPGWQSGGLMIYIEDYSKLLSWELEIIKKQTAGLSQEDSLIQPQPGGNCMNWVMGHLALNQTIILEILGVGPPEDLPNLDRYKMDTDPIHGEGEGVLDLQELIETYTLLHKKVIDRLDQMSEEDFEDVINFWEGKHRRGFMTFFYFFHNTYHLGQLEFLRNLTGKTEKVI